jgi:hypothetical protein
LDDTQPTASEKTTATSPTGASIGTASDQRPNPQHTPARRYPDIRLPEPTIELTDPVGAGLVNTLPQPGGNVTGFMGAPVGAKEACELEWSQVEFGRSASLHVRPAKKGKPAGRQHAELVAADRMDRQSLTTPRQRGGHHGDVSITHTTRYTALSPARFKDFWRD